jgi:hypothetical protein
VTPTLALDNNNVSQGGSSTSTPTGTIVGGVVGAAAGVVLIIASLVLYKRRKKHTMTEADREMFDQEFYGDPYRHNNWSDYNIPTGYASTSVQMMKPDSVTNDVESYKTHRQSWWSSVSTVFQKR